MGDSTKRSEGLSVVTTITFAVGTMVGAGVFVLSGLVINSAGPGAIISYIACAILVSFSGLSYAVLASIFPEDGGGYLYTEKTLGKYPGFLSGWIMYIAQPIVLAFVLLSFGVYLNLLLSIAIDPRIFAAIALLLITVLNLRGIAEAGKFEVIIVVVKVSLLVVFFLFGIFYFQPTAFSPLLPNGVGGVVNGIAMVFFAYMGFQVITMMGGEVKQSSKSVPIAMLVSILVVALVYVGVIIALLVANLPSYGSQSVFDAAVILMGPIGGAVIAFTAVLSTLSSANALTAGASRIVMEMASEKQIPGRLATLRYGQPSNAILLGSAVALTFILFGSFEAILNMVNVAMLIAMVFVNVGAIVLIRNDNLPDSKKHFRIPFGILFPLIGAATCIIISLSISLISIIIGIFLLFIGSIFYFVEDTPEGRKERIKIARELKRTELVQKLEEEYEELHED